MRYTFLNIFLFLTIFISFLPELGAEDKRTIPLDLYLIIDDSSSFQNSKKDAVAWLQSQVLDRILMSGDTVTVWAAGDAPQLIYSGEISSAGNKAIKDSLEKLTSTGKKADFTAALKNAESKVSGTAANRLPHTMLIAASAQGLESALAGNSPGLLKWSRSERYERWQVLVVAPQIGSKVSQAARAYMDSLRK